MSIPTSTPVGTHVRRLLDGSTGVIVETQQTDIGVLFAVALGREADDVWQGTAQAWALAAPPERPTVLHRGGSVIDVNDQPSDQDCGGCDNGECCGACPCCPEHYAVTVSDVDGNEYRREYVGVSRDVAVADLVSILASDGMTPVDPTTVTVEDLGVSPVASPDYSQCDAARQHVDNGHTRDDCGWI